MTSNFSDILLPRDSWGSTAARSRLIAFVPIGLALIGIAAIFLGGISVRTGDIAESSTIATDPVVTGSILTPEDRRRALQLLDR
jgi:hypothetical protein